MINYPIKKKTNAINTVTKDTKKSKYQNANMANRGMNLEALINDSNEYYRNSGIAVIHKKPVPVQIVKVNYPSRNKSVITEAYYKVPSTTDYNGIYKGKYIDFEAKENKNKTSFPLQNVHPHQVAHLEACAKMGGICFLIIYWIHQNSFFLYPIEKFLPHYNAYLSDGRESIAYDDFLSEAYLIEEKYIPRLDFLKTIDTNILKDTE